MRDSRFHTTKVSRETRRWPVWRVHTRGLLQEQESPWAHTLIKLVCVASIQQRRGKEFGLTSAGGDKTGEERVPSLPSRTRYVFRPPEVPFLFLSQTPASQAISKLVPERNGFPASHWLMASLFDPRRRAVVSKFGVEKARERLVLLGDVIVRKCIPVPTGTPRDQETDYGNNINYITSRAKWLTWKSRHFWSSL